MLKKKSNLTFVFIALALIVMPCVLFLAGCGEEEQKLQLVQYFKTSYNLKEELDVSSGVLSYTDEEGNKVFLSVSADMISDFDSETAGEKTMILTYKDETISIKYNVANFELGTYVAKKVRTVDLTSQKYTEINFSESDLFSSQPNTKLVFRNDGTATYLYQSGSGFAGTDYELNYYLDGTFSLRNVATTKQGYYYQGKIMLCIENNDATAKFIVFE